MSHYVYQDGPTEIAKSLPSDVPRDEYENHLRIDVYNRFRLCAGIRPTYEVPIKPEEGYRYDIWDDKRAIIASLSREKILPMFYRLLNDIEEPVNVSTFHKYQGMDFPKYSHTSMDPMTLVDILVDHEDSILDNGMVGIEISTDDESIEYGLDEHKLLLIANDVFRSARKILKDRGIRHKPDMPLIMDAEHIHVSSPKSRVRFKQLCRDLGVGKRK